MKEILRVENLSVQFSSDGNVLTAVEDLSFSLGEQQTLAIVGESGSGKSVTSLALMQLLAENGRVSSGTVTLDGENILALSENELHERILGQKMSMIFQEPMTALNPVLKVGDQITEVLTEHQNISRGQARSRALEVLRQVGIPEPEKRLKQYPHELSGGMRQRVMIAMALISEPMIMIADEPTTALDVTIEAQILELLEDLKEKFQTSILFVTHDLNVVADIADQVIVMYAGHIVERGSVIDIFEQPKHPYTQGLLKAMPSLEGGSGELATIPGIVPSIAKRPSGCRFHTRCPHAFDRCRSEVPLAHVLGSQEVKCHLYDPQEEAAHEL